MDRTAAKAPFAIFLADRRLSSRQNGFVERVIDGIFQSLDATP